MYAASACDGRGRGASFEFDATSDDSHGAEEAARSYNFNLSLPYTLQALHGTPSLHTYRARDKVHEEPLTKVRKESLMIMMRQDKRPRSSTVAREPHRLFPRASSLLAIVNVHILINTFILKVLYSRRACS